MHAIAHMQHPGYLGLIRVFADDDAQELYMEDRLLQCLTIIGISRTARSAGVCMYNQRQLQDYRRSATTRVVV